MRVRAMSKTISSLPLPPSANILTHNLHADPVFPSPKAWFDKLKTTPSLQRRARLLQGPAHFSYVSPAPLPFPYRIVAPDPPQEGDDRGAFVERWLAAQEPLEPVGEAPSTSSVLGKWTSSERTGQRVLLGVAPAGLRDCVPSLDVGDAFEVIGEPSLSDCKVDPEVESKMNAAREELVDVLGAHTVLLSVPPNEPDDAGYAPWSLRYSGHQFGSWAGQLGDGRAISILETPHPEDAGTTYELQLKGAGRTPFSRGADGLAVVRSSIREYLCSEAMHALGIPTTRSLALIGLPDLEVVRETVERACILTRVAPTFIRIGNFQALNPPRDVFVFGGGQQTADYDALRQLGLWVARRVLKLDVEKPWGLELVKECARRNALMLAGWQAYGFMHGVMNTDNISIAGLTIDYGPYAFMDVYDAGHICNHSDEEGRYAFKLQPTMIIFALRKLLDALAPLIGAEEASGTVLEEGWAAKATEEEIKAWREAGLKHQNDVELEIQDVFIAEYKKLMRRRLGLASARDDDLTNVIDPLLDLMQRHDLDFHATFRALATQIGDASLIDSLDASTLLVSPTQDKPTEQALSDMRAWLATYAARRRDDDTGAASMLAANPRFVLRQWVLEEVIKRVNDDALSGRRVLAKVLKMSENPFEAWGGEGKSDAELTDEEKEERKMCGLGGKEMLGFQCSCSS
ncbi:UPF0061-domain-containing protein [Exidia glandulosa HHB12029]|uniref:Selenoprotein O n=1 Tax=Exidia glandulosa HHB12029 TaxID=1314781 RepID=A0A165BLI6_EXIGL|nr:UPF0061-domain-containing protein [Exidia glandulosa HHB12029]